MPTHYPERGSSLLGPDEGRGVSTVTGQTAEERLERERDVPRRAAGLLSGGAELGLHIAPGSGDVLAAGYSRESGRAAIEALRRGEFGQAAGHFAEAVAHGVGAVPAIPPLFTGIMAGKKALSRMNQADRPQASKKVSKAARAEVLEHRGTEPERIWRETGFYRDGDGLWRFEVSDAPARLTNKGHVEKELAESVARVGGTATPGTQHRLVEVFRHDEFFRLYPEARNLKVEFDPTLPASTSGKFYEELGLMKLNPRNSEPEIRNTILHELQHFVQGVEGFAGGGNLRTAGIYAQRLLGSAKVKAEAEAAARAMAKESEQALNIFKNRMGDIRSLSQELSKNADGSYRLSAQGQALLSRMTPGEETGQVLAYAQRLKEGRLNMVRSYYQKQFMDSVAITTNLAKGDERSVAMALARTGKADKYYYRLAGESEARLVESRSRFHSTTGERRFPLEPSSFERATNVHPDSRWFIKPEDRIRGPVQNP